MLYHSYQILNFNWEIVVVMLMNLVSVYAKDCMEGLPWVDVICIRSEVNQACWDACGQRHGPTVKAFCKATGPGLPGKYCFCLWPC